MPSSRPSAPLLLGVVTALLLLNQVAFQVHVVVAHDGSPPFAGPPFPPWWFRTLHDAAWVRTLAAATPTSLEPLIAWSWLRVHALLEMPFALLVAATGARFLSPKLPDHLLERRSGSCDRASRRAAPRGRGVTMTRVVTREEEQRRSRGAERARRPRDYLIGARGRAPVVVAAISGTAILVLMSLSLPNALTRADVGLRLLACAVVVAAAIRWGADPPVDLEDGPKTPTEWLVAVMGLGFFGGVVLVIVWTTLLYNLADVGWLGWFVGPGLFGGWAASRAPRAGGPSGWGGRAVVAFAALFAPIALPVWYLWRRPTVWVVVAGLVAVAVVRGGSGAIEGGP